MKKILIILVVFSLFVPGFLSADEGNEVVVYTSLNPDETLLYAKAAEAATGLKVKYKRMSTGVVAAKLLAERKNPQADAVWGWGITYLRDFADRGFFEPYLPKEGNKLPAKFRDPNNLWFAQHMYLSGFAVNTEKLKEYNLPMPTSWEDLTKPIYKGHVIMPNPASSGTGFLMIAGMLETMDPEYDKKTVKENKAWAFLERLDKNMAQYIRSGSRPAKFAAKGECVVGASFIFQIADLKKEGKPVELVLPAEGKCPLEGSKTSEQRQKIP
jgi:iron(III) transport system substrate-binding protein